MVVFEYHESESIFCYITNINYQQGNLFKGEEYKMKTMRMIAVFSLIAGVVYVGCKFGTEDESQAVSVNALQIKDEVSQWVEKSDGFKPFNSLNGLTTIMNGGADEYYNRGVIEGFIQFMTKSGTEYEMEGRIMDFASADNAKSFYSYKKEDASTVETAGNYDQGDAFIDPDASLTGCKGYAHFGQYYVELAFTGYGSNKSEASNNASSFLEVFNDKIDKM